MRVDANRHDHVRLGAGEGRRNCKTITPNFLSPDAVFGSSGLHPHVPAAELSI